MGVLFTLSRQSIPVTCAPARRDEDRVSRPIVRSRRCRLRTACPRRSWHTTRKVSSLGACIQLSASIRHIERASPASSRPYLRNTSHPHKCECSKIPPKRPLQIEPAALGFDLGNGGFFTRAWLIEVLRDEDFNERKLKMHLEN